MNFPLISFSQSTFPYISSWKDWLPFKQLRSSLSWKPIDYSVCKYMLTIFFISEVKRLYSWEAILIWKPFKKVTLKINNRKWGYIVNNLSRYWILCRKYSTGCLKWSCGGTWWKDCHFRYWWSTDPGRSLKCGSYQALKITMQWPIEHPWILPSTILSLVWPFAIYFVKGTNVWCWKQRPIGPLLQEDNKSPHHPNKCLCISACHN